jgi:hypothetical protein
MTRRAATNPPAVEALRDWRDRQRFQRRFNEERDKLVEANKIAESKRRATNRRVEKTRTEKYASDLKLTISDIKQRVENERLHYENKLSDAKSKSIFTIRSIFIYTCMITYITAVILTHSYFIYNPLPDEEAVYVGVSLILGYMTGGYWFFWLVLDSLSNWENASSARTRLVRLTRINERLSNGNYEVIESTNRWSKTPYNLDFGSDLGTL